MKHRVRFFALFILPTGVFLFGITTYPMIIALQMSFFDLSRPAGGGTFVGLANFAGLLTNSRFLGSIGRSCLHTSLSVVFHFAIGLPLALLINKKLKGIGVLRSLLVIPWLLTPVVAATTWILLYNPSLGLMKYLSIFGISYRMNPLGHPDTSLLAVTLAYTWKAYPLHMLMYLAGLQAIPKELYEAAMIDGAGTFKKFFYITLPQLRGIILTVFLLDTIWTFRLFDFHFIMTEGGPMQSSEIMPLYLYKVGFQSFEMGVAAAIGLIMFGILAVICVFYLKFGFGKEVFR